MSSHNSYQDPAAAMQQDAEDLESPRTAEEASSDEGSEEPQLQGTTTSQNRRSGLTDSMLQRPGLADVVVGEGEEIIDGILQRKSRAVSVMPQNQRLSQLAQDAPAEAAAADAAATAAEPAGKAEADAKKDSAAEAAEWRREWQSHKKHFFVFSDGSRPVYTRHGNEETFLDFFGMMRLLLSLGEQATSSCLKIDKDGGGITRASNASAASGGGEDGRQSIRFVHAGNRVYVVYRPTVGDNAEPSPLYFVASSRTGETVRQLRQQLHLINLVLSSLLTETVYKVFVKRANYDLRNLLGGTEPMFKGAIHIANHSPAFALESIPVLPLKRVARDRLQRALRDRVLEVEGNEEICQYALLLYNYSLWTGPDGVPRPGTSPYGGVGGSNSTLLLCGVSRDGVSMHPNDFSLMCNFARVSMPVHTRFQELWAPFCMPNYNVNGYMYLYCTYLTSSVSLVLLSPDPDSFSKLSAAKEGLVADFFLPPSGPAQQEEPRSGPLAEVSRAAAERYDITHVELADKAGQPASHDVLHLLYKTNDVAQLTSTRFRAPFVVPKVQKQLLRAYVRGRERAVVCQGAKKTWVQVEPHCIVLSRVGKEYEMFIAFKPGTAKPAISFWTTTLKKWVRSSSDELFAPFGALD
eukprot:Hpha_TRINITY_DN18761_c0_g1::TRINITY_DN18761_c0_g1_i1::g.47406::m.47406/K20195/MON1; vacuolar fusion protein MON1